MDIGRHSFRRGSAETDRDETIVQHIVHRGVEHAVEDIAGLGVVGVEHRDRRNEGFDVRLDILARGHVGAGAVADRLDFVRIQILDEPDRGLLPRGAGGYGAGDGPAGAGDRREDARVHFAGNGGEGKEHEVSLLGSRRNEGLTGGLVGDVGSRSPVAVYVDRRFGGHEEAGGLAVADLVVLAGDDAVLVEVVDHLEGVDEGLVGEFSLARQDRVDERIARHAPEYCREEAGLHRPAILVRQHDDIDALGLEPRHHPLEVVVGLRQLEAVVGEEFLVHVHHRGVGEGLREHRHVFPELVVRIGRGAREILQEVGAEQHGKILREMFFMDDGAAGGRPDIEHVGQGPRRGVGLKFLVVRLVEENLHVEGDIGILLLEFLPDRHILLISRLVSLLVVEHVQSDLFLRHDTAERDGQREDHEKSLFH